ncbi:MAG: rod shape-determining protein MreC [Deltaproteobacteria bacterium]|nr:rod shape-determining protein MreC [Deltaproteobacteria bacterium]
MSSRLLSFVYPIKAFFVKIYDKFYFINAFLSSQKKIIDENKFLREEVERLKARENMLDYCQNENIQLKRFMDYRYESNYKLVLVRVVEYIRSYSKDLVLVDGGENKGIKKGMYAITDEGLAGKVIETTNLYSYIRLLSDRRSLLSVTTLNNQVRGIIQGEGKLTNRLTIKYIPMSSNVEINDVVVTSHSIETYSVPGVPIGIIKDVRQFSKDMFQEAYVMPFVKFDKIEFLFIIVEG